MAIEYEQMGNIEGAVPGTDIYGNPTAAEAPIGERLVPGVPPGAEPIMPDAPQVSFQDINGNLSKDDLRVRL
jgi:hypothetical protein